MSSFVSLTFLVELILKNHETCRCEDYVSCILKKGHKKRSQNRSIWFLGSAINDISKDDIDISIWFIKTGRSYHDVNKWYWKLLHSFLNKARLSLIFDWSWIGINFIDCARHYKFNYTGNSHHSLVSHNKLFIFPSKFTAFYSNPLSYWKWEDTQIYM